MRLIRLVLSDLHLGAGSRAGQLNPFEDFHYDERFAELLHYYDLEMGDDGEAELILNGDIFDLLKIEIDGKWPRRITEEIAAEKLRQCLEGHPRFVRALRQWLARGNRRLTYLPGNHDLDMVMPAAQQLLARCIAPGQLGKRLRFVRNTDTYYLPEGIQVRHGHQLERIHRVNYRNLTRRGRDGRALLNLPWGSLWILEVMNPAKRLRHHIDRIQPLRRFLFGALLFDTFFALRFMLRTGYHYLKHRVFAFRAWRERLVLLPKLLRQEIVALSGFDDTAERELSRTRGAHTLIVGHSHGPRYKVLPNGKVLVNTGTWMNMINLDIKHLGHNAGLTYALIAYDSDGRPSTHLMRWLGKSRPCEAIPYAE